MDKIGARICAALAGALLLTVPAWSQEIPAAAAPPLTVVDKGTTTYVIYHDPEAPASVKTAAQELQRVIKQASGVEIPLVATPAARMICLGDTAAARQASLSADGLADDAFRLVTRGPTVFILGKDSRTGELGWGGNENRGTLYGTYAFLERTVGVRWLLPDDDGEDIPARGTITVSPLDLTETPSFGSRVLGVQNDVQRRWLVHHGGGGWRVQHGHNWDSFPSRAVLREHPEYLALRGGQRLAVPADDKAPFQPKFCTTNPGLVQAFAEGAIAWLRAAPERRFVSISPSDGGGWCECPECATYQAKGPSPTWGDFGCWNHSVTPLLLRFYNDVARLVGAACPDRVVCGYVYYDFTFPPDPMPPLEPNLALMLAPLQHYGLTRYKPEYRNEFEQLCATWSRAASHVGYYGASTWMRVGIGAPVGPSLPLLKHTFATLRRNGLKSVYYYSLPWDTCGVHNYLVAKLMWNANADVDALFAEWLERAYGGGAPAMARLYALLDREMEAYKQAAPRARADYEMTSDLALTVYLKHFWTLESLYREALGAAGTPVQRARLEAFGDNLAILHHVFQEAGVLAGAERSIFRRTPEEYKAFLEAKRDTWAVRTVNTAGEQGGITGIFVPGKRLLAIPRLSSATPRPRLDGDLSDPAWRITAGAEQGQAVADRFSLIGGTSPATQPTRALATYDEQNLYISLRCNDNHVVGQPRQRDDMAIYDDDCVEVFVCASADDPGWYWHLTVNPANARWDALTVGGAALDAGADLEWESAAAQGEGYWAVEIRIPFSAVRAPGAPGGLSGAPAGGTWRVNLTREDKPSGENSSWSPVERGFVDRPAEFGRWTFPR